MDTNREVHTLVEAALRDSHGIEAIDIEYVSMSDHATITVKFHTKTKVANWLINEVQFAANREGSNVRTQTKATVRAV